MNKTVKITFLVCLFIGIALIIASIGFTIYYSTFRSNSQKIEGLVLETSNYDESYTIVQFEIDDKVQKTKLNMYSSFIDVGDTLILYYHNTTHKVIDKATMIVIPGILGFIGFIFTLVGYCFIHSLISEFIFKLNKDKYEKVEAVVSEVIVNNYVSINDSHPYQLLCDANYNNKLIQIKSKNIYRNIEFIPNGIVDVYFKNEKKYYIDDKSYREKSIICERNV